MLINHLVQQIISWIRIWEFPYMLLSQRRYSKMEISSSSIFNIETNVLYYLQWGKKMKIQMPFLIYLYPLINFTKVNDESFHQNTIPSDNKTWILIWFIHISMRNKHFLHLCLTLSICISCIIIIQKFI